MGQLKHNHPIELVLNCGQFTFSDPRSPSSEIPVCGVIAAGICSGNVRTVTDTSNFRSDKSASASLVTLGQALRIEVAPIRISFLYQRGAPPRLK